MSRVEYGIQMYSLRDITKDDLKGALKQVAEMGYKYVEFAGFFNNSAEDVKAWLDEYGLVCSGTHTGIPGILPEAIESNSSVQYQALPIYRRYVQFSLQNR